jgi:hypothetical protein
MNVYATNNTNGFEFQGSFDSVGEAMANATRDGLNYEFWWSDDADDPEWGAMPSWATQVA